MCVSFSTAGASSGSVSPTRREQPLFTLRQVGMICERLLKEREEKVREEYEETLTSKLAGGLLLKQKQRNTIQCSVCVLYSVHPVLSATALDVMYE